MLLTNILKSELKRIDNEWIKRSRKLTTQTIFSYMTEAYIRKRGIKHIINERKEMISDVAISKARRKLRHNCFQEINQLINSKVKKKYGAIYAIDGSKFHLNPKFAGVNEFVS